MNDRPGRSPMKRMHAAPIPLLTPTEPSEQSDGRMKRSQDSQQRIVAALLELVAEGNMTPSAEQVAERADIGLRSVFRHFKDMDSLYCEMADAIAVTIEGVVRQPFKSAGWREQVLELVDRRATVFEKLTPFLQAAHIHRQRSPFLKTGHERFVQALRQILLGLLPAKAARSSQLVEAIDLLVSFEAWLRLREDQGLDVAKARRVLKGMIGAVLREHSDDD
jgi:AcrR family transcriptional regulator